MPASQHSRHHEVPHRIDVPIVAGLALVMLAIGVVVPALEFDNLFGDETFSVLSGIWGFVTSGNILLAALLLVFSVLFPAVKLGTILVLWFGNVHAAVRRDVVYWLELLGKWSLLDAFVIAVVVGTVQLGMLSEAVARPGVYLYLAAILLSLLATFLLRGISHTGDVPLRPPLKRPGLWLTVPAALLYGAGLSLPLLEVEKGWFWGNRYSLLEGLRDLFTRGDWGLGVTLSLFVVVLPTLRFIALIVLRSLRTEARGAGAALRLLDRWSMLDVFVLALLVVFAKLGSLATSTPLVGMWLLLASAMLTVADSVRIHRRRRRGR